MDMQNREISRKLFVELQVRLGARSCAVCDLWRAGVTPPPQC